MIIYYEFSLLNAKKYEEMDELCLKLSIFTEVIER